MKRWHCRNDQDVDAQYATGHRRRDRRVHSAKMRSRRPPAHDDDRGRERDWHMRSIHDRTRRCHWSGHSVAPCAPLLREPAAARDGTATGSAENGNDSATADYSSLTQHHARERNGFFTAIFAAK